MRKRTSLRLVVAFVFLALTASAVGAPGRAWGSSDPALGHCPLLKGDDSCDGYHWGNKTCNCARAGSCPDSV
jgi:hypothetical protein